MILWPDSNNLLPQPGMRPLDLKQWHNYAVEWTPSCVTGFLDGEPGRRHTGGMTLGPVLETPPSDLPAA